MPPCRKCNHMIDRLNVERTTQSGESVNYDMDTGELKYEKTYDVPTFRFFCPNCYQLLFFEPTRAKEFLKKGVTTTKW